MPVNYLEQPSGSGGSRARITISSTSIAAADWEIEFKFRVPVGTTGEITLMGESGGTNNRFFVNFTSGVISFRASGTAYNSSASGITAGSVHIVRYSRVGTQTRFHLNGVLVSTLGYVVNLPTAFTLLGGASTGSSRLDLYYAKITSASINREWSADGITSGTVLPDIVSAQDATLVDFVGNPWKVEATILSLTNPMVPNSAFSGTCEGIPDGVGTLAHGGISIAVTVTSGAFSGTVPMFSDGILYPFLPATGAVWTLTVDGVSATYGSTLALPSGWDVTRDELFAVSNFAGLINASDTLQSAFVAESNDLTTSDRGLFPTANGLVVFRTSRVEATSLPYTFTMFVQRASGYVYEHSFTLDAEGVVATPPVMPSDAAVTVSVGATTVGTYAALSGTMPIVYTLGNTDAGLFIVDEDTAELSFDPAITTPDVYVVDIIGTNSEDSDSTTVTVTVEAAAPDAEITSVGTIRIGGTTAVTVENFSGSVNAGTIDGIDLETASNTSIKTFAIADGENVPRPGTRSLYLTDGTDNDTVDATVSAPGGWIYYTITDVFVESINGVPVSFLPGSAAEDDFILAQSPTTVSNAGIFTNLDGTQELFLVDAVTGLATSFEITTTGGGGGSGSVGYGVRGLSVRGL